jgi:hypothetical protein
MDRETILANIPHLSADQLYDYIKQGIVTLEELMATDTGDLTADKRKQIQQLKAEDNRRAAVEEARIKAQDDDAYRRAESENTEESFQLYLDTYPAGLHVNEATAAKNVLKRQRDIAQNRRQGILNDLQENHNYYTPGEIGQFKNDGILTNDDLRNCNIPDYAINKLSEFRAPQLQLGITPQSIPEGYTEVYFWGIQSSGKTCALSGVLNTAYTNGYLQMAPGEGYYYMTCLKNIFNEDIGFLPTASPVDMTQYLPFTLKKSNEKYSRSVSLIELSGEIFKCFFYSTAGLPIPDDCIETYRTINNYLKGNNRKIHFFFIDYSKHDNIIDGMITQQDYLNAAALYFKQNKIFNKTTDAIFIVTTKSDMMPYNVSRIEFAKKYLHNTFTTFVNTLRDICRTNSINGGILTVEPFSLGEVSFKYICKINRDSSQRIIDILMDRIQPQKKNLFDVFNK